MVPRADESTMSPAVLMRLICRGSMVSSPPHAYDTELCNVKNNGWGVSERLTPVTTSRTRRRRARLNRWPVGWQGGCQWTVQPGAGAATSASRSTM